MKEIRIRQCGIEEFDEGTVKPIRLRDGVTAFSGIKKGKVGVFVHELVFNGEKFDEKEAKAWAKRHGYAEVPPAAPSGKFYFVDVIPSVTAGRRARAEILYSGRIWRKGIGWTDVPKEKLMAFADRFRTSRRQVVLDYNHGSAREHEPDKALKAGKLLDVQYVPAGNDGGELWGDFELTDRAADYVSKGEYSFTSAEWDENYEDKDTGEKVGPTLLAVALTNRPVEEGQREMVLMSEAAQARTKAPVVGDRKIVEEPMVTVNLSEFGGAKEAAPEDAIVLLRETQKKLKAAEAAAGKTAEQAQTIVKLSEDLSTLQKAHETSEAARKTEAKARFFSENRTKIGEPERKTLEPLYDADSVKCAEVVKLLPVKYPEHPVGSSLRGEGGGGEGVKFLAEIDKVIKEDKKSFSEAAVIVARTHPELKDAYDKEQKAVAGEFQRTGLMKEGEVV